MPRIDVLLGKPPRPGTVVADALGVLEQAGVRTQVHLPHEEAVHPDDLGDADLVVHRGLSRTVDPLLVAAADQVELCNPWRGMQHTRDRADLHLALRAASVPTPTGSTVNDWHDVLDLAGAGTVVVKAVEGSGRGDNVLGGPVPLPPTAPMPGPYLVEPFIEHDGIDRKIYLAGDWAGGLLKPSTLTTEHSTSGEPFEVTRDLHDLARSTADALELHLVGVDIVVSASGPWVVDANPFPGYRSVEGAADAVAAHLLDHL